MRINRELFDLEYAETKPFPRKDNWRYFTLATWSFMVIALALVIVLSAAAVGYELEPYYSTDFNPPFRLWWSFLSRTALVKGRADCEPLRVKLRDTFTTRLNIFQYTVEAITYKWDGSGRQRPNGFTYNGTALENCTFKQISLTIFRPQVTSTLTGHVTCTTGAVDLDMSTSLVLTWDRDKDTIWSRFISQRITFSADLYSEPIFSPVLLTLMGLSVDVLNVWYFTPPSGAFGTPVTRHMSYMYTPRPGASWNWTQEQAWQSFESGEIAPWLLETNTSLAVIKNMFLTFPAAVLVDLGANGTLFHDRDRMNRLLDQTYNEGEARNSTLQLGWPPAAGLPRYDSPFVAQFLANATGLGINLPIPYIGHAVIDTSFFCRRWRSKTPTSFIGAVAAAATSFILAIWGAYIFVASYLAKGYEEKQKAVVETAVSTETLEGESTTVKTTAVVTTALVRNPSVSSTITARTTSTVTTGHDDLAVGATEIEMEPLMKDDINAGEMSPPLTR